MALKTRGGARLIVTTTEPDNYPHNTRISDFRRAVRATLAGGVLQARTYASYVENGVHHLEAWG